jgi:hypothetical protein
MVLRFDQLSAAAEAPVRPDKKNLDRRIGGPSSWHYIVKSPSPGEFE